MNSLTLNRLRNVVLLLGMSAGFSCHAGAGEFVNPSYACGAFPVVPASSSADGPQAGQSASVEIALDADGRIIESAIATPSGSPVLDAAVLDAVRTWRIAPASHHGKHVPSRPQYLFSLDEAGAIRAEWMTPTGGYVVAVAQRICGSSRDGT
ncbi:energy transducer TonB [Luteimonas cellulosilyticus]|uniref:energy transducer TonB n=1 Tax=Luteimonas cellulosilyticus TaxID=2683586 RepID=UPI00135BDE86|nr:TonB family protein [Luteimonas cellulosilyticus]